MMNFLDENFWFTISFIIFIYLVYKPVKKIILKTLDNKILEIQEHILKAEKLKQDAEILFIQTNDQVKKLELVGSKMLEEGEKEIDKIIQEKNKENTKFLEDKKINTIQLIESKTIEAKQALENTYCKKVIALVTAYFQSSSTDLSELDIIKNLSHKD